MPYKPASTALQDLVVLDLTHARAGPVLQRANQPAGEKREHHGVAFQR